MCSGYVKNHIVPPACAGPDSVANLQWQMIRDARANIRTVGSGKAALASSAQTEVVSLLKTGGDLAECAAQVGADRSHDDHGGYRD